MAKLTARRLLRTLNEQKSEARPLNMSKWRIEIREIRNQLIKLRDRAEDEGERIGMAWDEDTMSERQLTDLMNLESKCEEAVDAIAEAINQLDTIL